MPRAHLATTELTSLGERSHVAFGFDGGAGFEAAVAPYLAEGLAAGERVVCLLDDPRPERFSSLGDPDELTGGGRLALGSAGRFLDRVVRGDQDALLAGAEQAYETALGAGYRGLRVVVDVTAALAWGEGALASFLAWEQRTDRFFSTHRAVGACGLDRSRLGDELVAAVGRVHPIVSLADAEPAFRVFADGDGDHVCVVGALDAWSAPELAAVLAAIPGTGPVVLDVSGLEHLDHRGLLALQAFGRTRRPVRVRGARPVVRRLAGLLELDREAVGLGPR